MKSTLALLAVMMLTLPSGAAMAQSQSDREACEGDVFELCADKVPDEDRIAACLRRQWSKVSKECRGVMARYNQQQSQGKRRDAGDAATRTNSGY